MRKATVLAERESSFVATVQEGTPYRWTALDFSPNLLGSLRIAQITYYPPASLDALRAYDAAAGASPDTEVYSVRAIVRTLTASNKVEDFVVACFPLEARRLADAAVFTVPLVGKQTATAAAAVDDKEITSAATTSSSHHGNTESTLSTTAPTASSSPAATIVADLLPQRHDAYAALSTTFVLPCKTDIAAGLNVHVSLDGFTELRVEGPGTVTFSGEEKIGMFSPSRRECGFL